MQHISIIIKFLFLLDSIRTALADGRLSEEEIHDFIDKGTAVLLSAVPKSA